MLAKEGKKILSSEKLFEKMSTPSAPEEATWFSSHCLACGLLHQPCQEAPHVQRLPIGGDVAGALACQFFLLKEVGILIVSNLIQPPYGYSIGMQRIRCTEPQYPRCISSMLHFPHVKSRVPPSLIFEHIIYTLLIRLGSTVAGCVDLFVAESWSFGSPKIANGAEGAGRLFHI